MKKMKQSKTSTPQSFVRGAPAKSKPKREGRGCFSKLILLGILLFIAVGVGIFFSLKTFSSDSPVELPTYATAPGECEKLNNRLADFRETGGTLTLTADDLNAMLVCVAGLEDSAGTMWFRIERSTVLIDASLPLDFIPTFEGKYLNGALTFDLYIENGTLRANTTSITVDDDAVPDKFLSLFSASTGTVLEQTPPIAPFVKDLVSVTVADGAVTLKK